jgi:hypothetical protein
MRLDKIFKETAYGATNELLVEYPAYAPTYQEALTSLRVPLMSAAASIQELPQAATFDDVKNQKGPIGLSRAAQFIIARGVAWDDIKKTIGALSTAGKFDKMLPEVWQRQLLVSLVAGACKHQSPAYRTDV